MKQEITSTKKEGYYTNTKRKVIDFLMGFIVPWLIAGFYSLIWFRFIERIGTSWRGIGFLVIGIPLFAVLALIFGIIHYKRFRKQGRRYIAMGLLISVLIPIIIYGGCWLLILGGGS